MEEPAITPTASMAGTSAILPDVEASKLAPVAKGDKHLWGIYIFLCFISVIELYSASSREVTSAGMGVYGTIIRHASMLLAGFGLIYMLQRTHYRKLLIWIPIFAFLSVAMMFYTSIWGEYINGARRSFKFVFISIQPSEFLKLSAAAIVALIMSRCQIKGGGVTRKGVIWAALIILIFGGMLAPQGLTNTILLMCISFSMMIIGGIGMKKLIIVLIAYGAFFAGYLVFSNSGHNTSTDQTEQVNAPRSARQGTWQKRFSNYIGTGQPKYEEEINSENRQEMLGYIAQANSGGIGVGPGNSRETSRLPLAFTDYIYSIIVEELGLAGGLFVLILYLWLLARASAIASRCSRAFPALLVIGMALTIVFQALFHICIVTGVIPVSGQPLPLISKGGSSILVTSVAFGVMLSVSRFAVRTGSKKKDIKNEIEVLPEEIRAENPTQL